MDLFVYPPDPQQIYVATDVGVYFSSDAGVSFDPVASHGLSNAPIVKFAFLQSTNTLYAFTHGRGVYLAN